MALLPLVLGAVLLPSGSAQAAALPCIDLGLVKAGACTKPAPDAGPQDATGRRCANADLLPSSKNLTRIRRATLCLLNGERTARGLRPLREHVVLRSAAARYARTMVRRRFFAHDAPDGSTMTSRIRRTSYLRKARTWWLAENLAWGAGEQSTPAQTVRGWMDSPGHRRNVLDGTFRDIGIGIAYGAPARISGIRAKATYVTEFGRRR